MMASVRPVLIETRTKQKKNKRKNNQTDAGLPKQNDAANNGDLDPGAALALPRRPLRMGMYWVLDRLGYYA